MRNRPQCCGPVLAARISSSGCVSRFPERDAPPRRRGSRGQRSRRRARQLVAQRAACARLAVIWCVGAGPVEFFTVVDKGPVTQPPAPGVLCPVARIGGAEVGENGVVLCVPAARLRAVEIPEAIVDQNARLRRCKAEVGASGEIGAHIHAGIGLERMEADADLCAAPGLRAARFAASAGASRSSSARRESPFRPRSPATPAAPDAAAARPSRGNRGNASVRTAPRRDA